MTTKKEEIQTEDEFFDKAAKLLPGIGIPGYWDNLEENCQQWASDITVCPFWKDASEKLDQWKTEYRSNFGVKLLATEGLPKFINKGKLRIKSKLFQNFKEDISSIQSIFHDNPPIPKMNDLVRTRISCRYLDGVGFLAVKLEEHAKKLDCKCEHTYEGRLEGYFAQHINFSETVINRVMGKKIAVPIVCEIQIATDLSNRIWVGQHPLYEITRLNSEKPEEWQWNASDPRFVSRQLGHMIHLADGLLVQLREASKKT